MHSVLGWPSDWRDGAIPRMPSTLTDTLELGTVLSSNRFDLSI